MLFQKDFFYFSYVLLYRRSSYSRIFFVRRIVYTFDNIKRMGFNMNSKYRLGVILFVLVLVTSVIFAVIGKNTLLINLINGSFIISLCYLVIGLALYVIGNGFFSGISYSFKRFRRSFGQGKMLENVDDMDKTKELHEEYMKAKGFSFTKPFLSVGFVIIVLDFFASFLLSS